METILIKIAQFMLCLTILVFIHELGHFLMARLFKIRVDKFYIFFDPWFSLFKFRRGETEYGIGWLPLGGYCKIAGMIDESMDTEHLSHTPQPWEFRAKPAWQRFLVLIAGVTMNVLLAIVIYSGICYKWGTSYFAAEDAVYGFNYNDTAHAMGFEDGDKIVAIDGEKPLKLNDILNTLLLSDGMRTVDVERRGERHQVIISLDELIEMRREKAYEDFFSLRMPFVVDSVARESAAAAGLSKGDRIISLNGAAEFDFTAYSHMLYDVRGTEAALSVVRGADTLSLTVPIDAEGHIGVTVARPFELRTQQYTLLGSIPAGIRMAGDVLSSYIEQFKLIFTPKTKLYEELGGFIAIGNLFPAAWDWHTFWLTTAFMSIILAVMNIIPIPGLDGGHALFTLWEMITRRKPSDKFLIAAQYIGLLLILALVLYANGNDIYRLFIK